MKTRKWLLSLLTALLVVMMIPVVAFAEDSDKDVENDEFTVSIEAGLDGIAVEGKSMPVTVTVGNTGKDFNGVLRIMVPATYDMHGLAYEKNVTIPSGGEKSFSFMLSDIDTVSFLRIEMENEREKILYSQQHTFQSLVVGQNAVVGILSNDYSALNYFDGVNVSTYSGAVTTKILHLTENNIPETSEGLAICHYIIIDNYNTSQLSAEQRNAIANWVADGGMLIFGTGSKASITLEGFQDSLCDLIVGELSKQDMQIANSYVADTKSVNFVSLAGDNWQDVRNNISFGTPILQKGYGNGMVTVLSYDLAMEPIVSWNEAHNDLAVNILGSAGNTRIYDAMIYDSNMIYNEWDLQNAVGEVDRNKVPNALLYAAVFLVYVIAIGPVMYVILKAKDKREKMWIVMPIIAVVFTVIVYGTSMIYRIHKPFIDAISIVEFNQGSITTKTFMTVQSPKSKAYSVQIAEGYDNLGAWADDGVSYDEVGLTDYQYAIQQEGGSVTLNVEPSMAFSRQSLMGQKEDFQAGAGFDLDLTCSLYGFEGQVTNNTGYDLSNVVVCYNNQYAYLGHMKNGQSAVVTQAQIDDLNNLYYDLDQWLEVIPDDFVFRNSEEFKTAQDNSNVYTAMETRAYDLEMNQGMVFGMIDNYQEKLVQENNVKVYSAGVAVSYFYCVPEEYQNYSLFIDINEYMVGGDNIYYDSSYPADFDYFYDIMDTNLYGEPEMFVLYDFSQINLTGAQLVNISGMASELEDEDDYSYEEWSEVQLFNYSTGQYEDAFVNNEVLDLTPYISEEGWMQVRYYTDDSDPWGYYAPQISLMGGE
ncbi:MAG: hypothetical protein IJ040_06010 [Lachnospiraceae bacterium]|nr:hypothetical protein [Lachnospiraceae bacterium]